MSLTTFQIQDRKLYHPTEESKCNLGGIRCKEAWDRATP